MKRKLRVLWLLPLVLVLATVTRANPMTEPLPLPPFPSAAASLPAPAPDPHTVLTWAASTSAAACVSPCTFGYNVFRGTTTGGESSTPLNGTTPLTVLTYSDAITLTSSVQTYFYYVEAVETSSGITASSVPSNEVSATFPAVPAAPVVSVTTTSN